MVLLIFPWSPFWFSVNRLFDKPIHSIWLQAQKPVGTKSWKPEALKFTNSNKGRDCLMSYHSTWQQSTSCGVLSSMWVHKRENHVCCCPPLPGTWKTYAFLVVLECGMVSVVISAEVMLVIQCSFEDCWGCFRKLFIKKIVIKKINNWECTIQQ